MYQISNPETGIVYVVVKIMPTGSNQLAFESDVYLTYNGPLESTQKFTINVIPFFGKDLQTVKRFKTADQIKEEQD